MLFTEYVKNYGNKDNRDNDNNFTKMIKKCVDGGKVFGDSLLDYASIDTEVLICYLNIAMTSTATVKFKERMVYEKFSDAITVFEEAFAVLVLENNFERWVYFAEKKLRKNKDDNSDITNGDESGISYSDDTSHDDSDNTVEKIPDVLYQQKIKKRKDKRETAGKWTPDGMNRLNSLITIVQEARNTEGREHFEEELQDRYIKLADENIETMSKNKRKREMDEMNSRKKGVVIQNVLDFVTL